MNETVPSVRASGHMMVSPRQIFLLILLILLLLLGFGLANWMLSQCLAGIKIDTTATSVLGITSLNIDATADQTTGGEVINFNVTGDNSGPLNNALLTFNTVGKGTIQSAPTGTGTCVKVSDTQATCTNINLLADDELEFVVPVLVNTTCGLTGGDTVGLSVDFDSESTQDAKATASINCVAATSSSGTPPASSSSSSSSSSSGGTTTTNVDDKAKASYADQLAACYANANLAYLLGVGLPLLLILILLGLMVASTRRRQTVVLANSQVV